MRENRSSGLPNRSNTNWAIAPQKMARGLKFQNLSRGIIPCSKNKGTAQLRGYHASDLCLYFCICQKAGFLMTWLIIVKV